MLVVGYLQRFCSSWHQLLAISSCTATRDAKAIPQPSLQWLLVIAGTWQPPEAGTEPYLPDPTDLGLSMCGVLVQNIYQEPYTHANSCTLLHACLILLILRAAEWQRAAETAGRYFISLEVSEALNPLTADETP